MEREIELYAIALETNTDIDEVRSWPVEKVMRWLIALKQIRRRAPAEEPHATRGRRLTLEGGQWQKS